MDAYGGRIDGSGLIATVSSTDYLGNRKHDFDHDAIEAKQPSSNRIGIGKSI